MQLSEKILWQELEDAAAIPEKADFSHLCQLLEQAISLVPEHLQFQVAGDAFVQLAEIFAGRANALLDAWENRGKIRGPVLTAEGLADLLVRQSLRLDLDDLVEVPEFKYIHSQTRIVRDDSVSEEAAATVSAPPLTEKQVRDELCELAEQEQVSQWSATINHWWHMQHETLVSLLTIHQATGLTLVEVWLGLLLGEQQHYHLEQRSSFYDSHGVWLNSRVVF